MQKSILAAATAAVLLVSSSAQAIIFPNGTPQQRDYSIDPILQQVVTKVFDQTFNEVGTANTGVSGTLTLGRRLVLDPFGFPETDLNTVADGELYSVDIIDYALDVAFVFTSGGQTQIINFTPSNSTLETPFPVLKTDGNTIDIDMSDPTLSLGQGLINLVLDITPTDPSDDIIFPNGRRFGDSNLDLILASLFKGSVAFGTQFRDNGLPIAASAGEVVPGNTAQIASLQTAAIPVPATFGLMAGAVTLLGLGRLRRRA